MIFLFFYLFILAIISFFIITLIFIPYGFTAYSLITLITVPQQIINIAKNKAIRRNHALEHATINVLEKYAGRRLPLSGLAQKNGFIISGATDPDLVVEAACEGLYLLKKGECQLAIHRNCGTSIAIANFLAALLFLIFLIQTGYFSILAIIIALLVANLLGPYLGEFTQKYFTTSCDVKNLEIVGIQPEYRTEGTYNILLNYMPQGYFIRTQHLKLIKD
ncbi:MAG TPA: hypothetical protein DEG96_08095 [Candidatus Atribacteria bacterium]|nr:hypothetical protein [Candidatus Atribacteria bacterium]